VSTLDVKFEGLRTDFRSLTQKFVIIVNVMKVSSNSQRFHENEATHVLRNWQDGKQKHPPIPLISEGV